MKALNGVIDLEAGKIKFGVKAAPKGGADNESQPTRLETNRTAAAAEPRR